MNVHERPPKLLPWLASKARISDAEALTLWQRALAETAPDDSLSPVRDYSKAMDRLFELMAAESLLRRGPLYRLNYGFRLAAHLRNIMLNFWEAFIPVPTRAANEPVKAHAKHAA